MATVQRDSGVGGASLRALVERHRDDIKAVAARHHGRRVRLFGSVTAVTPACDAARVA
jgi:hypothetical protein